MQWYKPLNCLLSPLPTSAVNRVLAKSSGYVITIEVTPAADPEYENIFCHQKNKLTQAASTSFIL